MNFVGNKGYQGACYELDQDNSLKDSESKYMQNSAKLGGVVFNNNQSKLTFIDVVFEENYAEDGAVLYSLLNTPDFKATFNRCSFLRNHAGQNLMQFLTSSALITDSTFVDNWAESVNHGITLKNSNLEFTSSTVSFTDEMKDHERSGKTLAGFFSLFAESYIVIGKDTIFSNLKAKNQAVLSAYDLSEVIIQDGVKFLNNKALNSEGNTIELHNTKDSYFSDIHFEGNP